MLGRLRKQVNKVVRRNLLPKNEPDFIIIGAQKSGTSSLHYYLEQHPVLSAGVIKEIGYFHRDKYFGKSYESYKKDFGGFRSKLYFESTPEYLIHPDVAKSIYEKLPEVKMIAVLRDPVKRAYSAWNHYRELFETGRYRLAIKPLPRRPGNLLYEKFFKEQSSFPTFRECIDIELELIERGEGYEPALLRRGLYLQQLENYWQYFDEDQIMIIGFKDLVADTVNTLKRVTDFVGAGSYDWSKLNRETKNHIAYQSPMSTEDQQFLADYYAEPNRQLFSRIGKLDW